MLYLVLWYKITSIKMMINPAMRLYYCIIVVTSNCKKFFKFRNKGLKKIMYIIIMYTYLNAYDLYMK